MATDIVLQGVSALSPPGVYVQLQFAQGQSGAPTEEYDAVILANFTSQGSYSPVDGYLFGPDTLIPMQSVSDAIGLAGPGSSAALMVTAFKNLNQTTPLYLCPVPVQPGTAA